ncbi:MAG: RluA family pseudouridine synthase [Bacteroidota bacterium]
MCTRIKRESHVVPMSVQAMRLSDYVGGIFQSIPSRKGMKKAIKKNLVFVNGELASTARYLNGGEVIDLYAEEHTEQPVLKLSLSVLYEDDYLAVVNKPSGILVSGNRFRTLENALSYNLQKSVSMDQLPQARPVHRLDFPTSGVLLIAKTSSALRALKKQFEDHQIQKIYHAVVTQKIANCGIIEQPIEGKWASTSFRVLDAVVSAKYDYLSLLEVKILTGRRHQIRIHLSQKGNPILGDSTYGKEGFLTRGNSLYLHASTLAFQHPITRKSVEVHQALPRKFEKIFNTTAVAS